MRSNLSKYQTKNPIKKHCIDNFISRIVSIIKITNPQSLLDVGCGEGFVLKKIHDKFNSISLHGVDNDPKALAFAKTNSLQASLIQGDAYQLPFENNSFDNVMALELLEHLKMPEKALAECIRTTKKTLILSVPNEPIFSVVSLLSGKYFATKGRHPEHIQAWSQKTFMSFVSEHVHIKNVYTPFPWIVVHAEK